MNADHTLCAGDASDKLLRAWARAVAFYPDDATRDVVEHAVAHFAELRTRNGTLGAIDQQCADMLDTELRYRAGAGR